VQCAAHLQALMAAASAADGVRRLVLLCSGDNNVVGGKVRTIGCGCGEGEQLGRAGRKGVGTEGDWLNLHEGKSFSLG
jgi:hypothetical protein